MTQEIEVAMGKMPPLWTDGKAKSITLCVTEDCNLACKYCYMTGKNHKKKMTFETARKAVDFFLRNREKFNEPSVVWDFIGGEPFLEIDLIDKICDYIKYQMFILNHPWFDSYRFSFSTNGLLYHTPKVQEYIRKNKSHLSIGMSVDGNKVKHDLQRVKPDGSGSYNDVLKNVPLWLEQFPKASTKATFAHDDLPYLKDSIISLWDIGIKMVSANVVYEDVWEENDAVIMEQQLKELADYVLEKKLWREYSVRFFDPRTGHPLRKDELKKNYCGAGKMIAVDCDGNFFPCIRFYDFSLNNRTGLRIGDIYNGIDEDKVRPFLALTLDSQSRQECVDCDVALGCGWCQGCNYDMAETDTIYQRATYLCEMHKATVKANKYFWEKFEKVTGLPSERKKIEEKKELEYSPIKVHEEKFMQFITSDSITPHCGYKNTGSSNNIMSKEVIQKGLAFCKENGYISVMLGKSSDEPDTESCFIIDKANGNMHGNMLPIHDNNILQGVKSENSILLINHENLGNLDSLVRELAKFTGRINIKYQGIEKWSSQDLETYKAQLDKIIPFVAETYSTEVPLEINILTDIWNLKSMRNCGAGQSFFALAPNGRIYLCPAFYFENPDSHIGNLEEGINIKNDYLMCLEHAPICSACDVFNCNRCIYLNKKLTNEFNTPSKNQCIIAHIERNKSMELQKLIREMKGIEFDNILVEIDYLDPLEKILKKGSAVNA